MVGIVPYGRVVLVIDAGDVDDLRKGEDGLVVYEMGDSAVGGGRWINVRLGASFVIFELGEVSNGSLIVCFGRATNERAFRCAGMASLVLSSVLIWGRD